MIRKYFIPLVALAGVVFAVFTVIRGNDSVSPAPPQAASQVTQSPYTTFVAGTGIVEASTENISLGTHVAGIVANIYVQVGSNVKAGDALFAIDDRATRARIETHRAAIQVSRSELGEAKYKLALIEPLVVKGLISHDDLMKARFVMQTAEARLVQARAELKSSETELMLFTVRAPVDGQILQLKVHLGEYAQVAATVAGQSPLILLGSVTPLHVRVDVDENSAGRVRALAPAMGFLRGNRYIKTPLTFVRFEPFVVPKKSLTGDSAERVDTRVLQVIYSFTRGDLPIFVGQQMDVFIDAPELSQSGDTAPSSSEPKT